MMQESASPVRKWLAVAVVTVAAALSPAVAQTPQDLACANGTDSDQKIHDCTVAISSGRYSGADLAWAYNNRGAAYNAKSEHDRAIQDLDQAITLQPDYAEAYKNRGNAYADKGQYDRAIQNYNQAIRLKPDYAVAYRNRGTVYAEQSQYDRAIQDYDQAIRLKPDYADAYVDRGNAYNGKGQYDRAIQDFDQAIKLNPNYAGTYNNRGNAYRGKGQYDRAIQDYDQAIRLKPDFVLAYNNRGTVYAEQGQYDRAIQDYDQAIRLKPDYADVYVNRGNAYNGKGLYDRAIQDFDQAIRLKPNSDWAYNNRGNAYNGKGQYDRAIQDFGQAIKLNPNYAGAYDNRGNAYNGKGDYDRAIQDFDQAIKLNPNYAGTYNNRGNAYHGKGQYDRAIQDFDQAIRLKPDYAGAYNNRGNAYNAKGQYDRAIQDFNQAVQLDRSDGKYWGNRGFSYLKKGSLRDLDQAIADSEQALRLNPNLTYVKTNLDEAKKIREALFAQANAQGTGARVALVIGNANYLAAPPLPNARNDAEDVAKELKKLGYKIFGYPRTDFTRSDMLLELETFKKASIGASAAVVWYSGHGQQMTEDDAETPNDWVVPVDAKIAKSAEVAPNAIRLDSLKIAVLAAKQLRMVVIDACRNNPFYTGSRSTRGMGRSVAMPGVLLIQSTQPGNIAQDGEGRNSPFAQAFLAEMRKGPKRDVRQLMSGVQGGVLGLTRGEQKPQIDDGLATADTVALAP